MLYINFQLLKNKRKEQWDWRRRHRYEQFLFQRYFARYQNCYHCQNILRSCASQYTHN